MSVAGRGRHRRWAGFANRPNERHGQDCGHYRDDEQRPEPVPEHLEECQTDQRAHHRPGGVRRSMDAEHPAPVRRGDLDHKKSVAGRGPNPLAEAIDHPGHQHQRPDRGHGDDQLAEPGEPVADADQGLAGPAVRQPSAHQFRHGSGALRCPLDQPHPAKAPQRLPPLRREILRLPFNTPRPVPEALRVIINRATDRQERQRYRNARTLGRALEGWLQVDSGNQGGPLALLLDRMRIVGVLPASPGAAERAARLAMMDKNRTDELAAVLLDDIALAFELLRAVNTAQLRGGQVSGNGPVLTVRRAIAMLGLDGVRRVALALREWPGPLADGAAAELQRAMGRARRAGRAAVALRPPGYDGEVVYLVALLQNLGRLVVQYHLPDEALQIGRLMQSASNEQGQGEEPGMSEEAAAMAVLGVDLEAIASAVARWWGFDDSVLHMMRRHSTAAGVRLPESDHESLRISASCANEAIDALALPAARVAHALQSVAQRYARVLNLSLRDLQAALQPGLQSEPWPGAGTQRLAAAPMPVDGGLFIVFASSGDAPEAVAASLHATFGNTPLVGCTTAGEIGPDGYQDGSLIGACFAPGEIDFEIGLLEDLTNTDARSMALFAQALRSRR